MTAATDCRICDGTASRRFVAREMMYGTREAFDYVQCDDCGCLQIAEEPADMGRHYPTDYYSFAAPEVGSGATRGLKGWIEQARDAAVLEGRGGIGALIARRKPNTVLAFYRRFGLHLDDPILDVGAGSGRHVASLVKHGLGNAVGIDKFVPADVISDGRVLVRKADVFEIEGPFALIQMNHSFEHMFDQHGVMRRCRALLRPGGHFLLRVPTVTSEAWERYGVDWVQLDAPRHFYLHSHESLRWLAKGAGYAVVDLWCDSTAFQFWGSEQYVRDIPLEDARSYRVDPAASPFSAEEIAGFEREAERLNREVRGDQVCVVLRSR